MTNDNGVIKLNSKAMTKEAIRMAWPAVLESFFMSLAGLIDTAMVATLGSAAVAAIGLTTQPKFIGLCPFMALNMAVSAFVARRKGEQRRENANETLLTSYCTLLLLCIVVSIACIVFAEPLMRFCGSNADTHDAAVIYFRIIMGGCFFSITQMMFNAAQRGSGNTRISMTTNLASSITNIVFNYLLIGGHFGFPALGVTGAALATVLGTVVGALISFLSLFRKKSYVSIPFILKNRIRPTMETFKNVVKFSSNILIENLAMRVGFLATSMIAARLGTDQFAAHNVGMNLMSLGFSFADGMQAAGVALTGQALGAGKTEEAKQYGAICQRIGLFISCVLSLLLFFGGRTFFSLYFEAEHIITYGVLISRYIMVIVLLQISQIIYGACLRAAGDIKYTLLASLVSVTFIRTISTYILTTVFHLGLHGIWLGIFADQLSRFLFMSIRFKSGKWTNIRI